MVGLLAERVFGFQGVLNEDSFSDVVLRERNAGAPEGDGCSWV